MNANDSGRDPVDAEPPARLGDRRRGRLTRATITILGLLLLGSLTYIAIDTWREGELQRVSAEDAAFLAEVRGREMTPVRFVVEVPEQTPAGQPVYVAGSHPALGGWQPAGLKLERREDGLYHGSVEMLTGIQHKYKITRGSWNAVEVAPDGADVPDRELETTPDLTVSVRVAAWRDRGEAIPGRITTTGDIRLHERLFFSTGEHPDDPRQLIVYLPPGYDDDANADTRYPVLYLNDGQNLFNANTSYAGVEWQADEAAQELIGAGRIQPLIIVGIYNTLDRGVEYAQAGIRAYAAQLVERIKPFIDETYRTDPSPQATAIGGAQEGANAALLIAALHPQNFGAVAVMSPFVGSPPGNLVDDLSATGDLNGLACWIDTAPGTEHYLPGGEPVSEAHSLVEALRRSGATVVFDVAEDGGHGEESWQRRFPTMLQWVSRELN